MNLPEKLLLFVTWLSSFMKLKRKKKSPYFADVLWSLVRSIAEFPTNLEVTDTAKRIPQFCELLTAQYQYGLVGFLFFVLKIK